MSGLVVSVMSRGAPAGAAGQEQHVARLQTDAAGEIRIDDADGAALAVEGHEWTLCDPQGPLRAGADITAWVYRERHMDVHATFDPAPADGVLPLVALRASVDTQHAPHASPRVLRGLPAFAGPVPLRRVTPASYVGTIPAFPDYVLAATADGWIAEALLVRPGDATGPISVAFAFRRARRASGRIVDQHGEPVVGVRVGCDVAVRSEFSVERLRPAYAEVVQRRGAGASIFASEKDNLLFEQFSHEAMSDGEGRFHFELAWEGDVYLSVWSDGYRGQILHVGDPRTSSEPVAMDDLALTVTRIPPDQRRTLRVLHGGNPIAAGARVVLSDLTHHPLEFARAFTADGDGAIPAESLPHGSTYAIHVGSPPSSPRVFRYEGQRAVDTAQLPAAVEFMNSR